MTLLVTTGELAGRKRVSAHQLAPLAASLTNDLRAAFPSDDLWLPPEKARMTRQGGRCRVDGTLLAFDPGQPRRHTCPSCGSVYDDESDYRWWIMGYQLWLAERAVHAAALGVLLDDDPAAERARTILRRYAAQYLAYPNNDNVLGPTRVFFSTYLESIWLLQLAIATDLLETRGGADDLGGVVRERVFEPALRLIAEYDEAGSNRQVWNNAAIAAVGRLLGDTRAVERALLGPSGLTYHLRTGLLADGSWFEGENYHLFAHRGLWYGVRLAEVAGVELPADLVSRFDAGFRTPFLTALPDLTFPSRRDSQYRVSLRQWRIAESCELGLARRPDDTQLRAALRELYLPDAAPSGAGMDTGRATSTAEAERNVPGGPLTRADLGWKSLLFALPAMPALEHATAASVLLPAQGFAVLRRDDARTYVALDYGCSGNGHGHPDRLNLWLVCGNDRVLEDVGTGSYTSPTLHWYRSSLAHNAPFADGRSQWRVDGELLAYGDADGIGYVTAQAAIAPGVVATRALFVFDGFLLDELAWVADAPTRFELPVHVQGNLDGVSDWSALPLEGGDDPADGFAFVTDSERAQIDQRTITVHATAARGCFDASGLEWWRARAPGPPGQSDRRFFLIRARAAEGRIRSVWSWHPAAPAVRFEASGVSVECRGAAHSIRRQPEGWIIEVDAEGGRRRVRVPMTPPDAERAAVPSRERRALHRIRTLGTPWEVALGEREYRRSELPWRDAGAPTARVRVEADRAAVHVRLAVRKDRPWFAPATDHNPLDNEHPDTNSDGAQFYLYAVDAMGSWIMVPDPGSTRVRVTPRHSGATRFPIGATWAPTDDGWSLHLTIPRSSLPDGGRTPFALDLVVNEKPSSAERERRRGQLVLSGGTGWVFLRGDRQDPADALHFVIVDD